MKVTLEYFDRTDSTQIYSTKIREEVISGENDIDIFENYYKLNKRLKYCNGSYYEFKDIEWENKYKEWLKSDDYQKKSFNLYYGGGIVD
jgi:hypothetical protein